MKSRGQGADIGVHQLGHRLSPSLVFNGGKQLADEVAPGQDERSGEH